MTNMTVVDKYFIAVYTNEVKSYCDKKFLRRLNVVSKNNPVFVIDNSNNTTYIEGLKVFCKDLKNFYFLYLKINEDQEYSLFHRRVTTSVLNLREKFLSTDLPYFLIIESDVLAPKNLLKKLEKAIFNLDKIDPHWGIIGGLYHKDFHNYNLRGLQKTHHVLSGCTLYKRSLIEKYPFRWSEENMKAFPDAWICFDSCGEYTFYNYHKIHCGHMENPRTGTRYTR